MQSVTCPFCNITMLNIIDIVDQLLRATESGRNFKGYFPQERTTETVDSLLREWLPIIKHLIL